MISFYTPISDMKYLKLLAFAFIFGLTANAQTPSKLWVENQKIGQSLHPNPEAYKITQYGDVPINHSTGSPNITIICLYLLV